MSMSIDGMDFTTTSLDLSADYVAYLLRLWRDSAGSPWRASVQSVQTGEKILFADLDALFTFLESQTQVRTSFDAHE